MYWKLDRAVAAGTAETLLNESGTYECIYRDDPVYLFRLSDSWDPSGEHVHHSPPFLGSEVAPEQASGYAKSGVPGIRIRGIQLDSKRVMRGDSLQLTIEWITEKTGAPGRYVDYIRFDTEFPKGPS